MNHRAGGWLKYVDTDSLRSELSSWLSDFPWHWFVTLTFRKPLKSVYSAQKHFQSYLQALSQAYADPRQGTIDGVSSFLAVESFNLSDYLHLHGLIYLHGVDPVFCDSNGIPWTRSAWQWWFKKYGRAQVLVYDPARGAHHYLTKYIVKNLCSWDMKIWENDNTGGQGRLSKNSPSNPLKNRGSPAQH